MSAYCQLPPEKYRVDSKAPVQQGNSSASQGPIGATDSPLEIRFATVVSQQGQYREQSHIIPPFWMQPEFLFTSLEQLSKAYSTIWSYFCRTRTPVLTAVRESLQLNGLYGLGKALTMDSRNSGPPSVCPCACCIMCPSGTLSWEGCGDSWLKSVCIFTKKMQKVLNTCLKHEMWLGLCSLCWVAHPLLIFHLSCIYVRENRPFVLLGSRLTKLLAKWHCFGLHWDADGHACPQLHNSTCALLWMPWRRAG